MERGDLEKAVAVLLEEVEVLQAAEEALPVEVGLLVAEVVDLAECSRAKKNRNLKSIKNKNRKRS